MTLVVYFVITQGFRLLLTVADRSFDRLTAIALAGALLAVALGTWAARRFPPPVSPLTIRRGALVLLFLSGVGLIGTAGVALARG